MSNETEITVKGWVGQRPRLNVTRSGAAMTTLRVGSTPRRMDAATGEWVDAETSWFSVLTFGELADNVARSLRRGDPVLVRGRYALKRSEFGGKVRVEAEIVANAIGPDLSKGTALYAPMVRRASAADDDAREARWATEPGPGDADDGEPGAVADLSFAVELEENRPESWEPESAELESPEPESWEPESAVPESSVPDSSVPESEELVGTP